MGELVNCGEAALLNAKVTQLVDRAVESLRAAGWWPMGRETIMIEEAHSEALCLATKPSWTRS